MAKIPLRKINPNRRKIHYAREDIIRAKVSNRKRRHKARLIFLLVLLIILVVAGIFTLRWRRVQIIDIEVKGNDTVLAQEIISTIKPLITGHYAFVVPKASIFLYPRASIEQVLLRKFGYLGKVDMKIKRFRVLEISVTERTAEYVWCQSETEKSCFLADKNGFIFSPINLKTASSSLFKITGLGDGGIWKVYSYPVGENNFNQIQDFLATIPGVVQARFKNKLEVKGVELASAEDLIFKVITKNNGSVYEWDLLVNRRSGLSVVTKHLEAVFSSASFKNELNKQEQLEYVDFRFGQKVFYKHLGFYQSIEVGEEKIDTEIEDLESNRDEEERE